MTDPRRRPELGHAGLARLALQGGAETIQLRDKREVDDEALLGTAHELSALAREHEARLIVDDRVELARRCGAHGVHLGPTDTAVEDARARLGPSRLIGGTANDLEAAQRTAALSVDYLGVGPVFATRSKERPAPPLGLDGLARIVRAVDRPVIAIGGLKPEHVPGVLDSGAFGLAVLSAVPGAPRPERAASAFREAIEHWLAGRTA